jgi:hypothetical protein
LSKYNLVTELDPEAEPDSDLDPPALGDNRHMTTSRFEVIESLGDSYMDNIKNSNLTKEMSAVVKTHNLSLVKPQMYEMIRERNFLYKDFSTIMIGFKCFGQSPLSYIDGMKANAYIYL